jgi:hypothetical protein
MNTPRDDLDLAGALRALAEADEKLRASPGVEARLRREVEAIARARRAARVKTFALAASLALAVGAAVWSVGAGRGVPQTIVNVPIERTTDFYPLHYSSVPAADVHLVRLEVSRAALASFGLEGGDAPPNTADTTVLADVIVGSDGLARAIRFVGIEEQRQ